MLSYKRIAYTFLILLVCVSMFFGENFFTFLGYNVVAATDSTYPILNNHIKSFPYKDGFIVLSSDGTSTNIDNIGHNNSEPNPMFALNGDYIASGFSNNLLFIASNLSDNFIKIIKYNIDSSSTKARNIPGNILEENKFAISNDGNVFFVDSSEPSKISVFNSNFSFIDTIQFTERILSIHCNPSGSRLYVNMPNTSESIDVSSVDFERTFAGDLDCDDFTFIDDSTIVGNDGYIYKDTDLDFKFVKSYFKGDNPQPNFSCLYSKNIITNISTHLLYLLDYDTGQPLEQLNVETDIVSVSYSNPYLLIITKEGDNIKYKLKDSLSPLEKQKYINTTEGLPIDSINELYKNSKPKNSDINSIYSYKPDLVNYSTMGSLAPLVLEDAINSINFYRRSLSLPDLTINAQLCKDLQYTAVLALSTDDINNPLKPDRMSDEFFNIAKENLISSVIDKDPVLTPTVISDSINRMFNNDYYLRNIILSNKNTDIGVAFADDPNGHSAVVISVKDKSLAQKYDNFISYPQNGYMPNKWIDSSTNISVILNHDVLLCGERSKPNAKITNNTTGQIAYLTYGNGLDLSANNNCIIMNYPLIPGSTDSYTVSIYDVYNTNGIACYLEYNFILFEIKDDDPEDPDVPDDDGLQSDVYTINNNLITGINPGTTIASFKDNVFYNNEKYTINFINYLGKDVTSGQVGTSMKVLLKKQSLISHEYTIVIFGDLTGEGNINSRDTVLLSNYLLGKTKLSGASLIAADVDHNNIVDTSDLLLLEKFITNSYPIYQQ